MLGNFFFLVGGVLYCLKNLKIHNCICIIVVNIKLLLLYIIATVRNFSRVYGLRNVTFSPTTFFVRFRCFNLSKPQSQNDYREFSSMTVQHTVRVDVMEIHENSISSYMQGCLNTVFIYLIQPFVWCSQSNVSRLLTSSRQMFSFS